MYLNFHFGKFRDRNLHLSTLFFMPNFQPTATSQMTMFQGISYATEKEVFNSPVILGAWFIWKYRNRCVFDGLRPSVVVALQLARDEALVWSMAGAKGLSSL
jgi:hypothetical protein